MTPSQLSTLKAAILADPVLSAFPSGSDGAFGLAAALNQPASPAFAVWALVSVESVYDAISWDKFTPTDAPDTTQIYMNRLLAIQTKQMNLQNMLVGRESIDGRKANVRAGLRDAVIALPSGVAGASVTAGGASGSTVLTMLTRNATLAEKILVTSSPTTGNVTAGLMGFEGSVSYQDVEAARAA